MIKQKKVINVTLFIELFTYCCSIMYLFQNYLSIKQKIEKALCQNIKGTCKAQCEAYAKSPLPFGQLTAKPVVTFHHQVSGTQKKDHFNV